jgi:hypothetical protein
VAVNPKAANAVSVEGCYRVARIVDLNKARIKRALRKGDFDRRARAV